MRVVEEEKNSSDMKLLTSRSVDYLAYQGHFYYFPSLLSAPRASFKQRLLVVVVVIAAAKEEVKRSSIGNHFKWLHGPFTQETSVHVQCVKKC